MCITLEAFLQRVKTWARNFIDYDVDNDASRYINVRLDEIARLILEHYANPASKLRVFGINHYFEQADRNFSYVRFETILGPNNTFIDNPVAQQTDTDLIARCENVFYQLVCDHMEPMEWGELRPLLESSIRNYSAESIIGNLLMMHQIPGLNLRQFIGVIRELLHEQLIERFLNDVREDGLFYIYTLPDQTVVSRYAQDYDDTDNLVPLKPTVISAKDILSRVHYDFVAVHRNRKTVAIIKQR